MIRPIQNVSLIQESNPYSRDSRADYMMESYDDLYQYLERM